VVLARTNILATSDLPLTVKGMKFEGQLPEIGKGTLTEQVEALEKRLIFDALQESGGNQTKAGKLLGITERNLRYKLQKYELKN